MTTYLIDKKQINFDKNSIVIKHNGEEIKIQLPDDTAVIEQGIVKVSDIVKDK